MMTRKHFEAVAKIISETDGAALWHGEDDPVSTITVKLANYFQSENPNFDRVRFFEACNPR